MKSDLAALAAILTAAVLIVLAFGVTSPTLGLAFALVVVGALVLWRLGLVTLAWWTAWLSPLQAAFVIDVGITIRLAFLAGLALIGLAAVQERLVWPRGQTAARWLGAFLTVTLLATIVMTPFAPTPPLMDLSGWRGVPFMRPMIQCLQLAAMVGIMLVVARLARDASDALAIFRALWLSGLLVSAYGAYMFLAPLFGIPAIDINNAMNTNFTRGAVEHGLSMGEVSLPRVRSTFVEPLNFANYLLVVLAGLWAASRITTTPRRYQIALLGVLMLFLIAVNSRGAIFGAAVGVVALFVFAKAPGHVVRTVGRVAVFVAVLVALFVVVLPLAVPGISPDWLVDFFTVRLGAALSARGRVWADLQDVGGVVLANPLFGVGFGNLPFYLASLVEGADSGVVDAGSVYTRLAAETGLVGLVCYLGFLASTLLALVRCGRDASRGSVTQTLSKALYFVIVADAVQRVANVGIATDVHLWVILGLALGVCYRMPAPEPKQEARA